MRCDSPRPHCSCVPCAPGSLALGRWQVEAASGSVSPSVSMACQVVAPLGAIESPRKRGLTSRGCRSWAARMRTVSLWGCDEPESTLDPVEKRESDPWQDWGLVSAGAIGWLKGFRWARFQLAVISLVQRTRGRIPRSHRVPTAGCHPLSACGMTEWGGALQDGRGAPCLGDGVPGAAGLCSLLWGRPELLPALLSQWVTVPLPGALVWRCSRTTTPSAASARDPGLPAWRVPPRRRCGRWCSQAFLWRGWFSPCGHLAPIVPAAWPGLPAPRQRPGRRKAGISALDRNLAQEHPHLPGSFAGLASGWIGPLHWFITHFFSKGGWRA